MFIVEDSNIAKCICKFYENPDHIGWRDELEKVDLLEVVEPFVKKVRNLTLKDFIKNDRWIGITKNMDMYLPTIITKDGSRYDVLRAISISTDDPSNGFSIYTGKTCWLKGTTKGCTEMTIDIKPGIPSGLLYYETCVNSKAELEVINMVFTFLPKHIYRKLKALKQLIVPSQGEDYYLIDGALESLY